MLSERLRRWLDSSSVRQHPLRAYVFVSVLLASIYSIFNFLGRGLWESPLQIPADILRGLIAAPLGFLEGVLVTYAALWLFWRRGGGATGDGESHEATPPLSSDVVSQAVARILDSSEFLTALRDTFPNSHDPEDAYLAHVPYMLQTINNRRLVAERDAFRFFATTVGVGMLFACVVVYYGYILVNENAAGFPQTVAELRDATRELQVAEETSQQSIRDRADSRQALDALDRFDAVDLGLLRARFPDAEVKYWMPLVDELAAARQFQAGPPAVLGLNERFRSLDSSETGAEIRAIASSDATEASAAADLLEAQAQIASLATTLSDEREERQARLTLLKETADRASSAAEAPSNRIADIVKRVSVGFVVSSFLLAILRYLAGLYRESRALVAQLVEQELQVRRVSMALCTTKSTPVRDGIVRKFALPAGPSEAGHAEDALKEAAERDKELLKEAIQLLGKRVE